MEELLILGIGISEHKTDGANRFEYFCQKFKLSYKIVGEGEKWLGGDMAMGPGGGHKINAIRNELLNMENKLIVICDTFDLFPVASSKEIINKYHQLSPQNQIICTSEVYCWPRKDLQQLYQTAYPNIQTKYRYLNSGGIIGYSSDILSIIKDGTSDTEDDQLFYTLKYLTTDKIILDTSCQIFQAIEGSYDDIRIHKNRIYNSFTNSYPIFIHGNGWAKIFLNRLENYLELDVGKDYSEKNCLKENPSIFYSVHIDSSKPIVLTEFFKHFNLIKWNNFVCYVYDMGNNYELVSLVCAVQFVYRPNISSYTYDDFIQSKCDYYFLLEKQCMITNENIIKDLLPMFNSYRRIISPLLIKNTNNLFSNFWGELGERNGYYKRSVDYIDMLERKIRGNFNVPYVSGAVLFKREMIENFDLNRENKYSDNNIDMALAMNLRRETLFMYMCNEYEWGYLIEIE